MDTSKWPSCKRELIYITQEDDLYLFVLCNTYAVIILFKSHTVQFSALASSLIFLRPAILSLALIAAVVESA